MTIEQRLERSKESSHMDISGGRKLWILEDNSAKVLLCPVCLKNRKKGYVSRANKGCRTSKVVGKI